MIKYFDITCTATLRPELLSRTLQSFTGNLFEENIRKARLIINIDCIGAENGLESVAKINSILQIIKSYPFYRREINICRNPNFAKAFAWCMQQIENDFVFHLEEDWELLIQIDFERMLEMFSKYEDLVHLRLSAFKSEEERCKNWNKFLNWNGDFFEVKAEDRGVIGWAGHPSMNRAGFILECMQYIDLEANPEKQIKGRRYSHPINSLIEKSRFGCFHPQNRSKAILDIGRDWMVANRWRKSGNKAFFTNWEKTTDE